MHVLVADDEPIERLVITKKIQKHFGERLHVVTAENGEDAVALFRENQCEIAVLDISMPGIDGLEAAERIREMNSTCSIIFLTAFDEFSYAKKAFSVKALDYLLKPGSDDELVTVLEEAIRLAETAERKGTGNPAEAGPARQKADGYSADAELTGYKADQNPDDAENILSSRSNIDTDSDRSPDNARIRAVADSIRLYIDEHYVEDISLQDVAHTMGYSDAYFCKIFKQCFGTNFTAYLMEHRINTAKKLLADARINIKDICMQVGFRDSNYFTKVFKRVTGMTPSEYRNEVLTDRLAQE